MFVRMNNTLLWFVGIFGVVYENKIVDMEEDVHLLFCPIFLDVYVCVLVFDAVIIRLGRCQTHNLI